MNPIAIACTTVALICAATTIILLDMAGFWWAGVWKF